MYDRLVTVNAMVGLMMVIFTTVTLVDSHGRLWTPPARNTMWRVGFPTPIDYNDNALWCGGYWYQWNVNGGKCGVCGDAWDETVKEYEAGGTYATGVIAATYVQGQNFDAIVDITAHHKGWFEFRLCPVNDPTIAATHACLDNYLLQLADGSGSRYLLPDEGAKNYTVKLKLPAGLTCSQCVLQWKWNCGNNWDCDENGVCCTGCGPQEQFYGCSDVKIVATGTPTDTPTDTPTSSTPTTSPATTDSTTSQSTTQTSTTTTTTTTTTSPINGRTGCHSIPPFGSASMDVWCVNACAANYCLASHCACDGDPIPPLCYPIGIYENIVGMDTWCELNCALYYCPADICSCDVERKR